MRSKTVVWIPVLFVGALLFWTLAFGFGGMSLMAFTLYQDCPDSADDGSAAMVKDSYQSITVNLSELPPAASEDNREGEGAEGQAGAEPETSAVTVDLVSDHDSPSEQVGQGARGGGQQRDQGPGQTAF